MKKHLSLMMAIIFTGLTAIAFGQGAGPDSVKVPLTDPSRPATVKVNLLSGGITVKGYAGKEIVVDAKPHDEDRPVHRSVPQASGMKRIPNPATGLSIEEEDNVVSIGTGLTDRPSDLVIQVPGRTNLKLKTINDGDIVIDQVQGEIEVEDINGAVTLNQVSGSVVAHALNGNVKVSISGIEPNKPMSFSSLNGDIDVTFPGDVKATAVMKTENGEIFSDFDVKLDYSAQKPTVEGATGKGGKYKVKMDKSVRGAINGGGPEMQFKTFNGNIYIRKLGK